MSQIAAQSPSASRLNRPAGRALRPCVGDTAELAVALVDSEITPGAEAFSYLPPSLDGVRPAQ